MDQDLLGGSQISQKILTETILKLVTVACRTLNQPSTHTTEKSFTHLLTTKVEHVTVLIKQTALYKKNA